MSFENERYISNRIDRIEFLEQELAKVKAQLDRANSIIHHVVYNKNDSQGLAYEYLEKYELLGE